MLTKIEQFIFGGNIAHDIYDLNREGTTWKLTVASHAARDERKIFLFKDVDQKYEEVVLDERRDFEYSLPIIGFECRLIGNEKWRFLLNAADVEWAFVSKWPIKT